MALFPFLSGMVRRLLPLLAAVGVQGCAASFLWVTPERPAEEIPQAAHEEARWYRLSEDDDDSCLRIYLPPEAAVRPVPAAVIFPGGSYRVLALEKEGGDYARFLNRHGIAGIVVKYPLGSIFGHYRRHPAMLDAARRAIRLTRYYAPQLGIDPHRIGVMGTSAGGHLAGLAAAGSDPGDPAAADPVERVSGRPDFAVLCYPVVTMAGEAAHRRSREALLGDDPAPGLLHELSLEERITPDSPPMFAWQTREDETVDPENGRLLEAALERNGVPHRVIFYEHGPHGMGLLSESEAEKYPETARWPFDMLDFLREQGMLTGEGAEK